MARKQLRADLQLIASMIPERAKVLDIGCGDGTLLAELRRTKHIVGQGIELSGDGVHRCLTAGLSVIQGDADTDLDDYPAASFDYVVLSQTIQATHNPNKVLKNLTRIGRFAIVSLPNFGYWKIRLSLLFRGRMPSSSELPHAWHETPNIHLCTITDFTELCGRHGIRVERALVPNGSWKGGFSNLFDQTAVFLISKGNANGNAKGGGKGRGGGKGKGGKKKLTAR